MATRATTDAAPTQNGFKPVEFADLVARLYRPLTVELGEGAAIRLRWSPDALTPPIFAALSAAFDRTDGEDRDPFGMAAAVICPLVKEWDLTEQGAPYPITPEALADLGIRINTRIMRALYADLMATMSDEVAREEKKG
jgi:hypothetical protein